MLQLKNIVKTYETGDLTQDALKDVSIAFRENEFVSILGQSGSGKTTMLNIIGGLDRYTSGDLIINGVSTKEYKDADWDYYRNNSIGFVFQSYNLIPHQTVLANVEMALTLAGVSKKERRERAVAILKKVGLADHIHKKPNQMSGGQMQRVAIARALINNPDILLADEPTGALDSETSIQIMELLKEIAKDKLVIMVTHNPELAEQYSTRIIKLLDGQITSDSNPYHEKQAAREKKKHKKISMSFGTALSLSFNNLRTKKGRTLLTAFAGSIGIIGIALILSLSTGINDYIADVQKDTMASYPITISEETIDVSGLMGVRGDIVGEIREENGQTTQDRADVYADYREIETSEMITSNIVENNLTEFKKYLDDPDSEIQQYLGENGIVYTYDVAFRVYSYDADGRFLDSDSEAGESSSAGNSQSRILSRLGGASASGSDFAGAVNFSELTADADATGISPVITDSYDVLYGSWPEEYNEVVLVLDENNQIPADTLYQLGLITEAQYEDAVEKIQDGEKAEDISFEYEDVCSHTFYLVAACDHYMENENGTFTYIDDSTLYEEALLENALELTITGIVRPREDAQNQEITTAVGYTSKLTDYLISHTDESPVIKAQEANSEINVLTGMEFETVDDAAKAADAKDYLSSLGISEKASFYQLLMYYNANSGGGNADTSASETNAGGAADNENNTAAEDTAAQTAADGSAPADTEVENTTSAGTVTEDAASVGEASDSAVTAGTAAEDTATTGAMPSDESSMAAALDQWLANDPNPELLVMVYDEYIAGSSYEENMKAFGKVSYDAPSSISIYTDSFENKDAIAACIEAYNETAGEDARITYTDYVAMLTSSITTIIDGISYVLIAFVGISLIVSCIMIGIITHISVMERTKEIGILRALGASKRNISQVFNAETFIIGCCAGLLGIGVSLLALIPINSVIERLSGITGLNAQLPAVSALILLAISIVITILGGLLPAKKAAKKDPVIALRTE